MTSKNPMRRLTKRTSPTSTAPMMRRCLQAQYAMAPLLVMPIVAGVVGAAVDGDRAVVGVERAAAANQGAVPGSSCEERATPCA